MTTRRPSRDGLKTSCKAVDTSVEPHACGGGVDGAGRPRMPEGTLS